MRRMQVVGFYPHQIAEWGQEATLTICPQRSCIPERLVVSDLARDCLVTGLRVSNVLVFCDVLPSWAFGLPALEVPWRGPLLDPPSRAELTIRAEYRKPRRPWLSGSRAARKVARVKWWKREAGRKPGVFRASLICATSETGVGIQ